MNKWHFTGMTLCFHTFYILLVKFLHKIIIIKAMWTGYLLKWLLILAGRIITFDWTSHYICAIFLDDNEFAKWTRISCLKFLATTTYDFLAIIKFIFAEDRGITKYTWCEKLFCLTCWFLAKDVIKLLKWIRWSWWYL